MTPDDDDFGVRGEVVISIKGFAGKPEHADSDTLTDLAGNTLATAMSRLSGQ